MALDMLPLPVIPSPDDDGGGTMQHDTPDLSSESAPNSRAKKTSRPKILSPEEVDSIQHLFTERGEPMPNPAHSYFVGTVDDGEVTSFLVIQLRVHAEPMWIKEGNERVFRGLVRKAEKTLEERVAGPVDVFLFAPAGKVSQLAATAGMRLEPWNVYSKRVDGKAEAVEVEQTEHTAAVN